MALLHEAVHTARIPLPHLMVRGVDTLAQCPVYLSGALLPPVVGAGSTLSVLDPDGTVFLAPTNVSVVGDIARATITGVSNASRSLSSGWLFLWALTLVDGTVVRARSDAALVRTQLYPVISDVDIIRRLRQLDTATERRTTRQTNYQDQIDEAWVILENRLLENGKRPWLVLSPYALREVHLLRVLALVFDDLENRNEPAYGTKAQQYLEQYEAAWGRLTFSYPPDIENDQRGETGREAAVATVFLQ